MKPGGQLLNQTTFTENTRINFFKTAETIQIEKQLRCDLIFYILRNANPRRRHQQETLENEKQKKAR